MHLKAGQTGDAISQLETALELVPDRPKTLNYLGLAYAQGKALKKAKGAFLNARGNMAMVRRMEAAMRGDADVGETDLVAGSDLAPLGLEPGREPAEGIVPSQDQRFGPGDPPGLSELVRDESYVLSGASPFQLDDVALTLRIDGELRSRLPHLLWMRGDVARDGETKRVRGRVTEHPFGEGEDRVFLLKGHGVVALATTGLAYTPVELRDEAGLSGRRSLWPSETSSADKSENGRLPGGSFADLSLWCICAAKEKR